jgi:uncharacterized protein YqjF (DUF2071 family)
LAARPASQLAGASIVRASTMTDRFDRSVVESKSTAHPPWPMPNTPWLITQSWHDLLFAHWPGDPSQMRSAMKSSR